MRKLIAIIVLAVVLAACGSAPRDYNYYDYETGAAVRVTCEVSEWGGGIVHDSCSIIILYDGR